MPIKPDPHIQHSFVHIKFKESKSRTPDSLDTDVLSYLKKVDIRAENEYIEHALHKHPFSYPLNAVKHEDLTA